MEEYFKSEDALLQGIIDLDGDCIKLEWCLMCPFSEKCVGNAISSARLLPKEDRVRNAYERLMNKLIEEELYDR